MNYINYELEVEGIKPFSINLDYNQGIIEEINISLIEIQNQVSDEMNIKFILTSNINSNEDAFSNTQNVAQDIINLLFTKVNGRFGIPRRGVYSLNDEGIIATNSIIIKNIETVNVPAQISGDLKIGLISNNLLLDLKNNPIHRLFRSAMRTDDTTSRFMFLYGTLLAIEPTQSGVDRLITSEVPSIEMRVTTNLRNPGRLETKYTWLRNQIGHTNASTNMNNVEIEIADICGEFSEIVKKIINN